MELLLYFKNSFSFDFVKVPANWRVGSFDPPKHLFICLRRTRRN